MARIKVPFEINKAGLIEITASLNGKKGRFIVDTGATSCVLSKDLKSHFNVDSEKNEETAKGLGTTEMENEISLHNNFDFLSSTLTDHPLIVLDLRTVNISLQSYGIEEVVGIIGSDLLQRTKAAIYYSSKTIHLSI